MSRIACVLIGAPGSGKTSTGTALANLLGTRFIDLDDSIESYARKGIPDIFFDEGEEHFRKMESALLQIDLQFGKGVLALGGGTILAEKNRQLLVGHTVVYLSVELPDAIKRIGLGQGRPLLSVNPRATLKHLLDQRRPLYEKAATFTVITDGRTPEDVAAEIAELLKNP